MDTSYGQRPEYFGHADYQAARNAGKSNSAIMAWINSNMSKFSPGPKNQPGQGGLYDQILEGMRIDQQQAQAQAAARQQQQMLQQMATRQSQEAQRIREEAAAAAAKQAADQKVFLGNQARAGEYGSLQIEGSSKTPKTGGTQGFKRRKLQITPSTSDALSASLGGSSSTKSKKTKVLNV